MKVRLAYIHQELGGSELKIEIAWGNLLVRFGASG
jgi:hypothetical protein